jgi:putative flavoprotein involved in K+ transport
VTKTLEPPTTQDAPTARAQSWLRDFEAALTAGDVEAATAMFAPTSFWRDLVSFTWNLTTVEGRDGVRELLDATLATTSPSGFTVSEPATRRTASPRRGSPSRRRSAAGRACCG